MKTLLLLLFASTVLQATAPSNFDEAFALALEALMAEKETERAEVLQEAEKWSERLDDIAMALRPVPSKYARTGYIAHDRFTVPRLREQLARLLPKVPGPVPEKFKSEVKDDQFRLLDASGAVLWMRPYPDPAGPVPQLIAKDASLRDTAFRLRWKSLGVDAGPAGMPPVAEEFMNYLFVPKDYDPAKSYGLVIDLHGGAGGDTLDQNAARSQAKIDFILGNQCKDVIRVHLGAPKMAPLKWTFPESETHMQAVIEEYSTRYHIDPDRIYLTGVSMGGIGGWWHAFRIGDRFAMIRPVVGNYIQAHWPKLRGTFLYFTSGVFDSGNTRVDWARLAHQRLSELDIEHVDGEVADGHVTVGAGPQERVEQELIRTRRRDPYPRRACAVSPFTPKRPTGSPIYLGTAEETRARFPAQPYSFWVSIEETGAGGIAVEEFDTVSAYPQKFALKKEMMPAGSADAENLGGNRFRVRTTNVNRFALWLHPKMDVDFTKPVQIECIEMTVDATTKVEREISRRTIQMPVKPSLAAMMEYLADRRDFGLIYHAKVVVDLRQ